MSWTLSDVSVRFGKVTALAGVDMQIDPGVIQAVVGGDGAGKSTLLKVVAGLDLGQRGTVRLPGPGRTGYVPPDGGVFADLTVSENLEFVADAYRLREWRPRAAMLVERADLHRFEDRLAGTLSGGQRRKLAGSLAMLAEPDLLVLDEVTTGVDPVSRVELWRLIAAAAAAGAAVVVATSYLDEAERAESVLLLHDGRVLAAGSPESIISDMPGAVADRSSPVRRDTAWRRGKNWRQWSPAGQQQPGEPVTLEDAAIVAELIESGVTS